MPECEDERVRLRKENENFRNNEMKIERAEKEDGIDAVIHFAMQDTEPFNLLLTFKQGKLIRYAIAPN